MNAAATSKYYELRLDEVQYISLQYQCSTGSNILNVCETAVRACVAAGVSKFDGLRPMLFDIRQLQDANRGGSVARQPIAVSRTWLIGSRCAYRPYSCYYDYHWPTCTRRLPAAVQSRWRIQQLAFRRAVMRVWCVVVMVTDDVTQWRQRSSSVVWRAGRACSVIGVSYQHRPRRQLEHGSARLGWASRLQSRPTESQTSHQRVTSSICCPHCPSTADYRYFPVLQKTCFTMRVCGCSPCSDARSPVSGGR